jgi:arylsulfatase A-like enzyme
LLKTAGYQTAFIGNWHMPGRGLPRLRGVNQFISFTKDGRPMTEDRKQITEIERI